MAEAERALTEPTQQQPPRRARWTWIVVIAGGLLAALITQGVQEAKSNRFLPKGSSAPDFTFEKLGGGTVTLSELRGKVVMLDFWATWCPPCVEEMPYLVKLAKEYEPRGLVFIAANRDSSPNVKTAVAVWADRKIPGLARHVAFADDATTMGYKIVSLPTLYFIGRNGQVLHAAGFGTESQIRRRIEAALEE